MDERVIPHGSVVYLPVFDGLKLPNGRAHDGCFVAGDVGSAIQGKHIDIFGLRKALS